MSLLFDASSITQLLTERKDEAINYLKGESTLDLAIYELGNVVWKMNRRENRNVDETSTIVGYIEQVLGVMEIQRIQLSDIQEVMGTAVKLGLTFYDASYLITAKNLGKTLVTEDMQLRRAANQDGVLCIGVNEIKPPN